MRLLLTEGRQSGHKGAATLLPDLPAAEEMPGDKGYDSEACRAALIERGIPPCISPRARRKTPATFRKTLYKQRHKVETMFARLKDGGAPPRGLTGAPIHPYPRPKSAPS